jgi:hypothetical protein
VFEPALFCGGGIAWGNGRTGFLRRDPAFPPISRKLFIVDAFGARGVPSKPGLFQQRRWCDGLNDDVTLTFALIVIG